MSSKDTLKQIILNILLEEETSLSASALLFRLKDVPNNNLGGLTSKKIGSACGEMVREGLIIKEYKIHNHDYGFYSLTSVWMKRTEKWIRSKIPFQLPNAKVKLKVEKKDDVLDGITRIEKRGSNIVITVRIHISKNLLRKKNIQFAIKCVMIHEFCHIASPFNPDSVMTKYFPQVWKVWSKIQEQKELECSMEIKEMK